MIAMVAMLSTSPSPSSAAPLRRALLLGAVAAALDGCAGFAPPAPPPPDGKAAPAPAFVLRDGARLPYRAWLPDGPAEFVALALHGFNDSRDDWELPAPAFAAAGMAVYAPDQRGFGAAPERGRWPGGQVLVDDAAEMARLVRRLHPRARLVLMGESMGGAVLMRLAVTAEAPEGARYVLVAPAVWGRARMNVLLRGALWLASNVLPGVAVSRAPVAVTASDNRATLLRLSSDPLTIRETRFDTLRGLVDLMDAALAAAPRFGASGLFLYGGRDELVPKEATTGTWRSLPRRAGVRLGYYPDGYHLLLRDLGRAVVIGDVMAWLRDPEGLLPSGADVAAAVWLAGVG
jgi:alpha-beta hydrolase superfamily lysophospholipase